MAAGYSKKSLPVKLGYKAGMIHYFVEVRKTLTKIFPRLKRLLREDAALWISWPKGGKGATALNENTVRMIGLENGLVDIKVCAIDEKWSGLKFVYRLKDRRRPMAE